ncbi:hypothetical protein GCM10022223_28860 [Kineosporia mesophila]|uniref:DUF4179 domain-containing protein n=1 Tax=Kineosporia mesophila TaxID=566012 RepID=A0ABP6ZJJ3_9ACTN|nr:hypothetical protein [Kineosporia mesophila]MCD5349694.1 hypothetical protein [Kineosporia mesophila]
MADLRNIMYEAVSDITDPEESVVRTDLALGRQALARQHTRRFGRRVLIPVGLAAAAAGVVAVSVLGGPGGGSGDATSGISLIAYTGEQPAGFTVDEVPDGWEIQEVNEVYILVAPVGAANQDIQETEGKVEIHVADRNELAVDRAEKHALKVDDVTATRFTFPDPDLVVNTTDTPKVGPASTPGLLLPTGKDTLLFQFPTVQGWDDATIATFAAGVHLTDAGRRSAR